MQTKVIQPKVFYNSTLQSLPWLLNYNSLGKLGSANPIVPSLIELMFRKQAHDRSP